MSQTANKDHFGAADSNQATTLEQIYDQHAAFLWRVVRRLGVPECDVEDVCQQVFLVVHRKLPEFRGESKVSTWLFTIARRTVSDYRRAAFQARRSGDEFREPRVEAHQGQDLQRRQARVLLDQLLESLDEDKREVFVLCVLEELPPKIVADMLERPVQTIYSRLQVAKAEMERGARRLQRGEGVP